MPHYDRVNVLLVDNSTGIRDSVREIFHLQGFRNIRLGTTLADVHRALVAPTPDIMILGAHFDDGDVTDFVRRLRHHEIGDNPFIPVIVMTGAPTAELVKAVIDSGADDLLTVPLSTAQLVSRVETLVNDRKPFVVTGDYVGPDRRKDKDRPKDAPKIEVPNTFRSKVTGEPMTVSVQEMIDKAVAEVNVHKLERYAFQIGWLAERIAPAIEDGKSDKETADHLDRLVYVCEDAGRRMRGTKYEYVGDLCRSMLRVAERVNKSMPNPAEKDIRLLMPLSQAIQQGFADVDSAVTAQRIAASVEQTK